MADTFAADPREAARVARELTTIRTALDGTANLFAGTQAPASGRIERALERFREDSSQSRQHLAELLNRASGLLSGLAEGATAVDRSLSDALEPEPVAQRGGSR